MNSITAWHNMTTPTRSTEIIGNVEIVDKINVFLEKKKNRATFITKRANWCRENYMCKINIRRKRLSCYKCSFVRNTKYK